MTLKSPPTNLETTRSDDFEPADTLFPSHLEALRAALDLSPVAVRLLTVLYRMEHDAEFAAEFRERSSATSPCVTWHELAISNPGAAARESLNLGINALLEWGLIGHLGSSGLVGNALQLTFFGRTCLEGGPVDGWQPGVSARLPLSDAPVPWLILHSASREDALIALHEMLLGSALGDCLHLLTAEAALREQLNLDSLCGRLAVQLTFRGVGVVDAYPSAKDNERMPFLETLIRRTAMACALRILLVDDPGDLRMVALQKDVALRWIPPRTHARRRAGPISLQMTKLLDALDSSLERADTCGVPDSRIAPPTQVETRWEDLVLPKVVAHRANLILRHALYRIGRIEGSLALRRGGPGYRLLVSGPPGTGKSMIAEAMAHTLEMPVCRFDLSTVLSRWMGETEKRMSEIFDVAEAAGALLILDEADAVMAQRGASARGAMMTGVAHLLTRLEHFSGVLVATTNRVDDLDDAFFRRFDDYLLLTLPDADARLAIWQMMLQGVETTGVDLERLARECAVGGALIRGAAVRALAWRQEGAQPLSTALLLASLVCEYEKSNKGSVDLVPPELRDEVETILGRI